MPYRRCTLWTLGSWRGRLIGKEELPRLFQGAVSGICDFVVDRIEHGCTIKLVYMYSVEMTCHARRKS